MRECEFHLLESHSSLCYSGLSAWMDTTSSTNIPAQLLYPASNRLNFMIWSFGQMAFCLQNDNVELAVTESGGHLAPVTFTLDGGRQIQPFSIAPWWNENTAEAPLLQVLRGDFFCMPFGANNDLYEGERYLPHGETANCPWSHVETVSKDNKSTLHLQLNISLSREKWIRSSRSDRVIQQFTKACNFRFERTYAGGTSRNAQIPIAGFDLYFAQIVREG